MLPLLLVFAQAAAPGPAPGSLASYFKVSDYPRKAIKRREEGTVRFQIDIGPEGRVSRCTVTASSGSALLDSTTCRLAAQRLRFRPARDSAGQPIADTKHDLKVIWRLPR